MKITYRFETPVYPKNILYVNLIDNYRCVNDCLFCSRPRTEKERKPNIYETKTGSSLFLPHAPTIDEIISAIHAEIKEDDAELAIIGLGEPLLYMQTVIEVIEKVKRQYDVQTRIDTNGLVLCWQPDAAERLATAGLDAIRISVNAVTEEEYRDLCRPRYDDAFANLCTFVRQCTQSSIDTFASFVVGFDKAPQRTPEEYIAFAQSLEVQRDRIILRNYVPEQ